jgi:hypothetical protein
VKLLMRAVVLVQFDHLRSGNGQARPPAFQFDLLGPAGVALSCRWCARRP